MFRSYGLLAAVICLLGITTFSHAEVRFRRIIMLSDPVPGAPEGWVFGDPTWIYGGHGPFGGYGHGGYGGGFGGIDGRVDLDVFAVLNAQGQCAFLCSAWGQQSDNATIDDDGIWLWDPQQGIRLIAFNGHTPAGYADEFRFSSYCAGFGVPHLTDDGQVMFLGGLSKMKPKSDAASLNVSGYGGFVDRDRYTGQEYQGYVIWQVDGDRLTMLSMSGAPVPGYKDLSFVGVHSRPGNILGDTDVAFNSLSINRSGQIACKAGFKDISSGEVLDGIWLIKDGKVKLLARTGGPAPGMDEGVEFRGFEVAPMITRSGQVLFQAMAGAKSQEYKDYRRGMWVWDGESLKIVPGMPDDYFIRPVPGRTSIDNQGNLAFVTKPDNDPPDFILWYWNGETLQQFDRFTLGQEPDEQVLSMSFCTQLLSDSQGRIVIVGTMHDPASQSKKYLPGIWRLEAGSNVLEPILLDTDKQSLEQAKTYSMNSLLAYMNHNDQFVIQCELHDPDTWLDTDRGVWFRSAEGTWSPVIRQWDSIDVNNDPEVEDLRTVAKVDLYPGGCGEDGQPIGFNDRGDLLMRLSFTDGTMGLFIATIEP